MSSPEQGPVEHAEALCEERRLSEASRLLRELLDRQPGNGDAWSLLGRCEFADKHYEAAADAAEHALRLAPERLVPHMVAAVSLLALGRADQAVEHAREAVRIQPSDWRALAILARALSRSQPDVVEAREIATRVTALAANEPDAHLAAGIVAAGAGDHEQARRSFRRVLDLDPASSAAQHELARLRLRRHVNDPASLADAAAGFARAARANPEHETSRLTLEATLRVALSKAAYILFIDAFLVGRLASSSDAVLARLLPVALIAIPAGYAWRFLTRLPGSVRRHLVWLLTQHDALRLVAALEALAVMGILAAAVAPGPLRPGFAGAAAVAALIGRVLLYSQVQQTVRAARGQPHRPVLSSGLMWLLAGFFGLIAIALLVASAKDAGGVGAVLGAAAFAAGAAAFVRSVRRRTRGRF